MSDAEKTFTRDEAHKEFAVKANGRVWELLRKEDRSQVEDDELLYAAYGSCYHWLQVGTGVNLQRGEYMIAKAYINLNNPVEALRHARRVLELTDAHREEMQDFDFGYSNEIMARALAMNGDKEKARKYHQLARKAGDQIADAEDKKWFDGDFEGGEWFGLV
jgi:tetratricopeptide (TPR) repeat protein